MLMRGCSGMIKYRIPLLSYYVERLGAETGEFAEWEVPMRFESAVKEHMYVRSDVAFFDVSHMGRIRFKGADVLDFIQYIYTKDLSKVKEGFMSGPTLALNSLARVKDDEMLYKISDEEWLVVVNATYREKMLNYFNNVIKERGFKVDVEDLTFKYSMLAVQGPRSVEVMEKLGLQKAGDLKPLEFTLNVELAGSKIFLVSRSGWTGEDGFEIWGEHESIRNVVEELVKLGVKPAGIIARDSLRTEMGFVLGEHEYGEDPLKYPCALSLRYGMGAITWSKRGFVGEEALRACRREGVKWIRVGLKLGKEAGRVVPRKDDQIYVEDQLVGWVTSGVYSPVLNRGIAQAYIAAEYAIFGESVDIAIRGKRYEAKIVDFPFIKK